jgi:NodT family efflux transporter outer membrane factor (OMF) lipoprotein
MLKNQMHTHNIKPLFSALLAFFASSPVRHSPAVALCALLVGCAVGPDYVRPALPDSKAYSTTALPAQTDSALVQTGAAQRFVIESDIRNDWWTLFQSKELNDLIEKSFLANPNIEVAKRALKVAQEGVYAQQGFFFPTVAANYTPTRTKIAGNLSSSAPGIQGDGTLIQGYQGTPANEGGTAPFNGSTLYNFHTAQLTVGFVPDVFGANRRMVETAQAQTNVQRLQLQASYITLATNIVASAVQDGLLRKQISITQEMIEANTTSVELVRRQHKAGFASLLDLSMQQSALNQVKQLLPPLQKQFEQNRDLLRVLAGLTQDQEVPAFNLDAFKLPEELPLTLPAKLIEQRPDVRVAEEQLRAANAQIGVARAARLPQFLINGSIGGAAANFDQMFWSGSGAFFQLMLGITQPIFDGGTLMHREYAATETQKQAAAQYRATVLNAFQNVADTLHAISSDAQALSVANDLTTASRATYDLTGRQHASGYLDRLALINAQQTYRQALLSLSQAQASRLGDTAALFQALGGGWWNRSGSEQSVDVAIN